MKIILFIASALMASQLVLAESTINCPVGVITATDKFDDNNMGKAENLELKQKDNNFFEGEIKLLNKTLAMLVHKDEYIDLYEASTVLLDENNQKLIRDGFLLKYNGMGDDDWNGPKGTDFLAIINGSLQQMPARFVLTWDAFKILNSSYGVSSRYFVNLYEIQTPLAKAIQAGALHKGEVIAIGIFLGCNLKK